MSDTLLDTTEAGKRLGGIKPAAVLHLIASGALRAKSLVVRGKHRRPRKYVPESEIERYIRELPDAGRPARRGGRPRRAGVRSDLEQATRYY